MCVFLAKPYGPGLKTRLRNNNKNILFRAFPTPLLNPEPYHAIQNQLAFDRVLCCTLLSFVRFSSILPPLVESSKHFRLASRSCTLLLTAHHDPLYRKALKRQEESQANRLAIYTCITQANPWTSRARFVLAKTGRINHSDQGPPVHLDSARLLP